VKTQREMGLDKHSDSEQPQVVRSVNLRLLGGLSFAGLLLAIIFWGGIIHWPPDSRCKALLAISDQDVAIPIPANCVESPEVPPDAMVKYLDDERKQRGLVFKTWITCKSSAAASNAAFDFQHDPRWLPSYRPRSYQLRRTVVILPYAQSPTVETPVAAEVCLVPKRKYASQIAGQCDGKFAVWK
jgi:hypothetical protein